MQQPVPDGYDPLEIVGYTDCGEYLQSEIYTKNDIVHKDNTAWRCLKDNTTGIAPAEGENWTVFIVSETVSSGITTVDTEGLVGTSGEKVSNQALIDALAERAVGDRAMLSDAFSAEKTYTAGDYAIYNNTLYRFTAAKPVGAWDASKAVAVTVAGELGKLSENIKNKEQVDRITVTSLCPNNYIVGDQSIYVKNGVCFVWLYIQCVENIPVTQNRINFVILPKPKRYFTQIIHYNGVASNVMPMAYRLNNDGSLEVIGGENTRYYSAVFSYLIED